MDGTTSAISRRGKRLPKRPARCQAVSGVATPGEPDSLGTLRSPVSKPTIFTGLELPPLPGMGRAHAFERFKPTTKPQYDPEPRRMNEKTSALLGAVVKVGIVPAGQRIPDHRVTVRSALSLGEPDRAERRGRDKTAKTRGNGQRNRGLITVCRTLTRGLVGRAAAATASWRGGMAGSQND